MSSGFQFYVNNRQKINEQLGMLSLGSGLAMNREIKNSGSNDPPLKRLRVEDHSFKNYFPGTNWAVAVGRFY